MREGIQLRFCLPNRGLPRRRLQRPSPSMHVHSTLLRIFQIRSTNHWLPRIIKRSFFSTGYRQTRGEKVLSLLSLSCFSVKSRKMLISLLRIRWSLVLYCSCVCSWLCFPIILSSFLTTVFIFYGLSRLEFSTIDLCLFFISVCAVILH